MNQQQWLNLIIITISGLILAFVLLGRFLDPDKNKIEEVSAPMELRLIDFGAQRLVYNPQGMTSEQPDSWTVYPESSLSKNEIKLLVKNWQELLLMTFEQSEQDPDKNLSGTTVLLFFEGSELPLVARVSIKNAQAESEEVVVNFIAEEKNVVIKDISNYRLLPKQ